MNSVALGLQGDHINDNRAIIGGVVGAAVGLYALPAAVLYALGKREAASGWLLGPFRLLDACLKSPTARCNTLC
jgi:hypothetical protein